LVPNVLKVLFATRVIANTAFTRRRAMQVVLAAWGLNLSGAALPAKASGEPPKEGSKPMTAKSKSAASKASFEDAELVALFPEALGEWTRKGLGKPIPSPYAPLAPALLAEYTQGPQTIAVALSTWMPASTSGPAPSIQFGRDEAQNKNHATLMLRNGLSIGASSHGAGAEALGKLINSMDLARAAQLVKAKR
jgi:hypothetical protein